MIAGKPNYVGAIGPEDASIMFVGEAPGAIEDQTGRPFSGPSGELLWEISHDAGIDRRAVYVTNVVKYRPPMNDFTRLKEIGVDLDQAITDLWTEIDTINPNVIVALGDKALKALTGKTGITKWRGSCLQTAYGARKVIPTIHPAALLHAESDDGERRYGKKTKGPLKYSWRHIIRLDLLKAVKESETHVYEEPNKVLEIARDSVQLGRFLDLYKDAEIVSVDIEVDQAIPYCVGLAFNNWHAISVPLFDIWKVYKNEDGPARHQLGIMHQMVAGLLASDIKVIGQNFKFDQERLARMWGIHVKNLYADTSLLAHCLHSEFPKSLEFNTSIYTSVPYYKEEGKEFNWGKDKVDRVLNYNAMDACVTYEVFEELIKDAREMHVPGFPNWAQNFCLDYQRALHYFYTDLETVGFAIDHGMQVELTKLYEEKIQAHQKELNELAGWEVNVAPRSAAILVYNQLKYPQRKGTGEEVLIALMANTKNRPASHTRMLELILLLRRLKLSKKKYFEARVDFDGRMKTGYTISGTETGRSNTKILKPPTRPIKMGIPFHTITKHGDIGTEIRRMFVADPGYVIVETDMSQAEARIVALLGEDYKLLKLFAAKADIHKITASLIFGIKIAQVSKEIRFIGKTTRHAGNYDMGKHRLMEIVNTDAKKYHININISEWKAGQILDTFHRFSPNIRGVFHESVQKALRDNNRVLVNPFGRYRQFFDRWGIDLFKEAYAHVPQSTVPDQIRHAGIRAKQRFTKEKVDARFAIEGHDSLIGIVWEPHLAEYVEIMHYEIQQPIDFSRCTIPRGPLSIPAESKWGYNYLEMSPDNPDGLRTYVEKAVAMAQ